MCLSIGVGEAGLGANETRCCQSQGEYTSQDIQIQKEVDKKCAIMFGTESSPEPEIMAQGVNNSAGLKPVLLVLKNNYLSLLKLAAVD